MQPMGIIPTFIFIGAKHLTPIIDSLNLWDNIISELNIKILKFITGILYNLI